jgi:hypothetical protein
VNVRLGAKRCFAGVARREINSPITLANHHLSNVSIGPESGSRSIVGCPTRAFLHSLGHSRTIGGTNENVCHARIGGLS